MPQQTDTSDLASLYDRPGFLLRRAHQIAVSIFLEETAAQGVTTASQFGLMVILRARAGIDQIGLAKLLGLDRSTTGLVISKLEAEGLLERRPDAADQRRKALRLTRKGHALLQRLETPSQRTARRVMEPFTAEEAKQFLLLLKKFVCVHNANVRIPMAALAVDSENPLVKSRSKRK
jgi:MarR family transcriptional regulator, lower aerobic nicotinate degradation pathway regulator